MQKRYVCQPNAFKLMQNYLTSRHQKTKFSDIHSFRSETIAIFLQESILEALLSNIFLSYLILCVKKKKKKLSDDATIL